MRKIFFFIAVMVLVASPVMPEFDLSRLELRFGLGPAFWHGGDFNQALQGGSDYNHALYADLAGAYKKLGLGYNITAEGVYWLQPRLGAGLDLTYTSAPVMEYSLVGWDSGMDTTLDYSAAALAVKPGVHYGFPLCEHSFLDFVFGPAFYFGCFHFAKDVDYEPDDYTSSFRFDGHSTAFGLHGGVSVDYELNEHWRLYGKLNMELNSLGNLKDEWTYEQQTPGGTYSQSGKGTLWIYDYQPNGAVYPLWGFGSNPPSGPEYSNARKGSIGGPSVGVAFGIKYKF